VRRCRGCGGVDRQARLESNWSVSAMALACGSSITGSHVVSSQRCNANRTRHMPLRSIPMLISVCENGSPILAISIGHPQRTLNEVHYARWIGKPSLRTPHGQEIDTRGSGVPPIFECQITSYGRPRSVERFENLSLKSVQIRAHDCVWIVGSPKSPAMHRPASMKLPPDGQFTLPLDDSAAKVRPSGCDIALAC
jgi:hypothetical protein